ncbi:multiheme c-type cytochrome [Planctomyces sp. SH-PL14]|uniref:multiheme c-type cytochrome n=1 Tax=Planctomyces sp. SH-PL14 TaxID=1632864 RepID=UPI00078E5B75|nr:multiheme c-type cytochrome [Planctomyces sp. SH-PL14]AMV20534.1 Cytochrome c-554 precursor [Planctomyces sp. SH-PL14]
MTILVSCDTAGWIVPCGCSTKQAGGLLRRASYAEGLRTDREVVLLDAGGAPGGKSPYDRTKFEAVLRGEVLMGVAAHNIGAAEAELGWDALQKLAAGTRAPFVASNVAGPAPGRGKGAEIPRTRVVALGGLRLGVLGVLSPSLAPSDWTLTEPREAILQQLPALKAEKVDQIVVLAYLPEEELAALAGQVPEVDLVIGGPTQQSIAPKKTGPTVWGSTTNKGKFLVRLDRETAAAGWEGRIVELDESIPDEKQQTANLQTFRDELLRVDFTADQTSFVPPLGGNLPKDFRVVGTEQCRACHEADCRVWEESGHARGWETLVGKGAQMDPYCQQCHTTGYGLPGGFASLKSPAALTNIGCESCHGPGQAHASRPATRTLYRAQDRCTACHDHDNSPEFQFEAYWARIEHGRSAATGEGK